MILDVEKHAKKYIEFIRTKSCSACYDAPVDADHLNAVGMGNDRKKARIEDFSCIPLCRKCHSYRHHVGNLQFEMEHKVELWKDANGYLMEYLTK